MAKKIKDKSTKKISLSLDVRELNGITSLIDEKMQNLHSSMLVDNIEVPLRKKLLDILSDDQKKEFVRLEIKKVLFLATGMPVDKIGDKQSLTEDLHLNSFQIRVLSIPFTNVAKNFKPDATLSADECEECDTVNDCVDLVYGKS